MANVGVLGAGSWGTALSVLLHDNGHEVTIWSIDQKEVEMLNTKREHEAKLPGVKLAKEIVITNELNHAINGKDFLVLAVPSIFTRSTARKMSPFVAEGQMIVDVAKGIEEATLMTLSEQIHQEIPQADVAVLSGPSHAEEVGRKLPTTCVIGAKTKKTAEYLQSMFNSRVFRVYTSPDILGIELGHCTCSRNRRRIRLWGQYKGSIDYPGHCRDSKTGNKNGWKAGNFYRTDRNRRPDRYMCQCPQQKPEGRLSDGTGKVHAGGNG